MIYVFFHQIVREAGNPLGITVVGGADTKTGVLLIKSIQPNSAAGKSGYFKPGDQVLQVNQQSLVGKAISLVFIQ